MTQYVVMLFLFLVTSLTHALELTHSTTLSRSAKNISVTFTLSDPDQRCYANLYKDNWAPEWLAEATIIKNPITDTFIAQVQTPDYAVSFPKKLSILCGNKTFNHSIPQPPSIRLSSRPKTTPDGLELSANTYIDNHEGHAKCWSSNTPTSFDLLALEENSAIYFYSNYFGLRQVVNNQDYTFRVALFCQNTGGTTIRAHVWAHAYHGAEWQLFEDITMYE